MIMQERKLKNKNDIFTEIIISLKVVDALSRETSLSRLFLSSSEKSSTL